MAKPKITPNDVSEQLLSNPETLKEFKTKATYLTKKVGGVTKVIDIEFRNYYSLSTCSTHENSNGTYTITLTPCYENFFPDIKYNTMLDVTKDYERQKAFYLGIVWHEVFHVILSPFGYFFNSIEKYNSDFQSYLKNFFNITCDDYIEDRGSFYFPASIYPLSVVKESFNREDSIKNLSNAIETSPKDASTFLSYLLLKLRSTMELPAYPLWDNNKDWFDKALSAIKVELDPNSRADLNIAIASAIAKYLNTGELPPDDPNNIKSVEPGDEPGVSGTGPIIDGPTAHHDGPYDSTDKPSSENNKIAVVDSGSDEPNLTNNDKDNLTALINQNKNGFRSPHHFVKNIKYKSRLASRYNDIKKSVLDILSKCINAMRRTKSRNLIDIQHFLSVGELDMDTIHMPCNPTPFCLKIVEGEAVRAIIYLLIDVSGSMGSTKCSYVGKAAIILSEICVKLQIPFGIYAFSEDNSGCFTVILKDPRESFYDVKDNLVLIHDRERINEAHLWCGNIDEVNVTAVCEKLLMEDAPDKYLIVLSDGETCGSPDILRDVVKHYESKGIITLGIGVKTDEVEKIYDKSITFNTDKDLEKLPTFLGEFLLNNMVVRKGGK